MQTEALIDSIAPMAREMGIIIWIENLYGSIGGHLKVLHIHDNDGVSDLHRIPFTFMKTRENRFSTDWDGFIRGLQNIDFQGILSFETHWYSQYFRM